MLFAFHPPTLALQITLLQLAKRHAERCCELAARATGERLAGVLHEGAISLRPAASRPITGEALDSADRQVCDLIGDSGRLGQLAWEQQIDYLTSVQRACFDWQQASFTPR